MPTNVPSPTFGATGFIAPAELSILAGAQADINAAFGGNLNISADVSTPQGQIATTLTAIIADKNAQFLKLTNDVDPAFATGRMQDSIGRIYFLSRIPARATVVTATCTGAVGTVIPLGSQARDASGHVYTSTASATIPAGGSIDITFQSVVTGALACPPTALNYIYRAISGWDTVNNVSAGVVGRDVETRAEFEFRRINSVAGNGQGTEGAVLGAVINATGVVDAYVISNPDSVASGASFTGSISATTLTVSGVSGTIKIGDMVNGAAYGTVIMSGSGTTWTVNVSQSVSGAMTSAWGGVRLLPHSIYVAAYGGSAQDIANAIFSKKSPGCNYNGSSSATVMDTTFPYTAPYPSYTINYQIPTPTPIIFNVTMQQNSGVPADAATQVKNAIIARFNGTDGSNKMRIGCDIFHSNFYAGIFGLGAWAQIYDILIGIGTASRSNVRMRIDQIPTIDAANITVTFA